MVLDGIKEMLIGEVIEAGIKWLIGILGGPAGAFIKACMAIYDIVMWFVNNGSRLMDLAQSVIGAAGAIAGGDVGGAAKAVEQALARAVPATIGFLASLLGLGDLGAKVRKIVERVQAPINKAIDFVLDMVKGFVMQVAKVFGFGGEGAASGQPQIGDKTSFSTEEEEHQLWIETKGNDSGLMMASANPKRVSEHLKYYQTNKDKEHIPKDKYPEIDRLINSAAAIQTQIDDKSKQIDDLKSKKMKPSDGARVKQLDGEIEGLQKNMVPILDDLVPYYESFLDHQVKKMDPKDFMDNVAEKTWNVPRGAHTEGKLSPESMEKLLKFRADSAGTVSPLADAVAEETAVYAKGRLIEVKKNVEQRFNGKVKFRAKDPKPIKLFSPGSEKLTSDIDYDVQGDSNEYAVEVYNNLFRGRFGRESGTYFDINVYAKGFIPGKRDITEELKDVSGELIYDESSVNAYGAMIRQMHQDEWDNFKNQVKAGLSEEMTAEVDSLFARAEANFETYVRALAAQLNQEVGEDVKDIDSLHSKLEDIRNSLINKAQAADSSKSHETAEADANDEILKANNALYRERLKKVEDLRIELLGLTETKNKAERLLKGLSNGKNLPDGLTAEELENKIKEMQGEIDKKKLEIRKSVEEALVFANEAYVTKASITAIVVEGQMKGQGLNKTTPNTAGENVDAFNEQSANAMHHLHIIAEKEPITAKPQKYIERMGDLLGKIGISDDESKGLFAELESLSKAFNAGKQVDTSQVESLRSRIISWTAQKTNAYYRQVDAKRG